MWIALLFYFLKCSRKHGFSQSSNGFPQIWIWDFRGFSKKAFDGRGNYTLGIKEQIIFPEIDYEKIDSIRGLDIAITTSAKNDEEAKLLLEEFNFPFRR